MVKLTKIKVVISPPRGHVFRTEKEENHSFQIDRIKEKTRPRQIICVERVCRYRIWRCVNG